MVKLALMMTEMVILMMFMDTTFKKISQVQKGNGHGTHCAGGIGAAHNGEGKKASQCSNYGVKIFGDSGAGTLEGAIKAIDYAIMMKADIMSNFGLVEDFHKL